MSNPSIEIIELKTKIEENLLSISVDNLKVIAEFVEFIKLKQSSKIIVDIIDKNSLSETVLLSESSLKKDWLKPEENDAWQNL